LFKAIKAAKSTKPKKVKKQLMKLDFDGASKHVKFEKNGDSGSSYIAYKIVDGKYVAYWSPIDGYLK
ncbi:MAG: branched-chain amino acid ABC transporter substrate-binding protein, partial [Desulfobacula sp.]|nr:branched-chain amino acid ABC transporter substrate-binding protein [Desulfobacula sp.]